MNKLRSILLSAVFLLMIAAPRAHGQTAEEIVAKHISALGGKEKVQSIHSLYLEGVAVLQNGTEINTKTWKIQGKLYRQEINFGMGNIIIIVTPQKGWIENPRTGGSFTAMPDDQVKALQSQLDPAGPLVDYAAQGSKIELAGKDTVSGKECYRIRLTSASGETTTYSIDTQSWYILRETRKGGSMFGGNGGGGAAGGGRHGNSNGEISLEFADYQKNAEGYTLPNTIMTGMMGAKTNIEKIEVNKTVDVTALSKPSN